VGCVPKGPAAREGEAAAAAIAITQLQRIAKEERVRLLLVQPPPCGNTLAEKMPELGFDPSPFQLSPTATCVLDLSPSSDDLLEGMSTSKRRNLRTAERKGVTVREGCEDDLPLFYRILLATAQRQNFSVYPEGYFRALWRIFCDRGSIRLALADHGGEIVSGQLVVAFNATVVNKASAWSGAKGQLCPNELLQWSAILWAKNAGYRWYDFEGVARDAAEAVLRNAPLPEAYSNTVTSFKLGFGGKPRILPDTYDYVPSGAVRWAYRNVLSKLVRPDKLRDAAYRFRTRGARNE
jgi:lipid II:glycine glycyltransferase (peptidoglycan interpeptide bridge formation enzyme)